ncbi:unnamed protein product [Ixodes pacificus]
MSNTVQDTAKMRDCFCYLKCEDMLIFFMEMSLQSVSLVRQLKMLCGTSFCCMCPELQYGRRKALVGRKYCMFYLY